MRNMKRERRESLLLLLPITCTHLLNSQHLLPFPSRDLSNFFFVLFLLLLFLLLLFFVCSRSDEEDDADIEGFVVGDDVVELLSDDELDKGEQNPEKTEKKKRNELLADSLEQEENWEEAKGKGKGKGKRRNRSDAFPEEADTPSDLGAYSLPGLCSLLPPPPYFLALIFSA